MFDQFFGKLSAVIHHKAAPYAAERERADLVFGRGVHFCLGAHLARAEAQELVCGG